MAWERRGDNLYYYQAEREQGRVRKRYVGTGPVAEAVAHADTTIRRVRSERRERESAELEEAKVLLTITNELDEAAEVLVRAHLLAAGCHRHKGEWRRARA